ncbi:MAG: hypothetical protein Q9179_006238 [Wetmoreana sp. 5 TL-2023]
MPVFHLLMTEKCQNAEGIALANGPVRGKVGSSDRLHSRLRRSTELIDGFIQRPPAFEPNGRATYCNVAFVLLGFALETLTGLTYDEIVKKTVFDPVGMQRAMLKKPPDSEGVIPNMTNDWDADIGTYGPYDFQAFFSSISNNCSTGGIYTTASDLALFARSILAKQSLATVDTNAWFKPHSYSSSWEFAYGMPWEIFRTSDLIPDSDRIQTIITKAGSLTGYTSQLLLIPEHDVGIVLLVAGESRALAWLREEMLRNVIPAIETIAREQTNDRLSGTYTASYSPIDSSVSVEVQGSWGLVLTSWISNGTDFLTRYVDMRKRKEDGPGKVQLTPSGIKRGSKGEVWRAQFVPDKVASSGIINTHVITDVDQLNYASRSLDEFVFELDASGNAVEVELPALRVKLRRRPDPEGQHSFSARLRNLMKPLGLGH